MNPTYDKSTPVPNSMMAMKTHTHHHGHSTSSSSPSRRLRLPTRTRTFHVVCSAHQSSDQSSASVNPSRREALLGLGGSASVSAAVLGGGTTFPYTKPAWAASAPANLVGGERVKLSNGAAFPLASFGLQVYDDETARQLTLVALEVGYRNFFASVLARNQRGFAKAVRESDVPRSDIYICGSVLSNSARGYDAAFALSERGCKDNMNAMKAGSIEKLDMIMLDYPGPDAASIRGQWAALEQMKSQGLVDDLAVSNFTPAQLDVILEMGGTAPVVNQLPFSLANQLPGFIDANRERGILVQSWSPLSRLSRSDIALCREIGEAHGNKSPYQVALRFIVQSGASFSTQTRSRTHFQEDLDVFDWSLTDDEMARLRKRA